MRPQIRELSAVAISDPIVLDYQQKDFKAAIQVALSAGATLTYSVQTTLDDPHADYSTDFNTDADWFDVTDMADITAAIQGNLIVPVRSIRLNYKIISGTAKLTVIQPTDY